MLFYFFKSTKQNQIVNSSMNPVDCPGPQTWSTTNPKAEASNRLPAISQGSELPLQYQWWQLKQYQSSFLLKSSELEEGPLGKSLGHLQGLLSQTPIPQRETSSVFPIGALLVYQAHHLLF